jgi:hypothetical protein
MITTDYALNRIAAPTDHDNDKWIFLAIVLGRICEHIGMDLNEDPSEPTETEVGP